MKFAKWGMVAGICGLIVLPSMYFMEEKISRKLPPAITHPEYFNGFLGGAVAWQILFLVLSRNPLRYRHDDSIIDRENQLRNSPCRLFTRHRLPLMVLGWGSVDWILAILFLLSYWITGTERE